MEQVIENMPREFTLVNDSRPEERLADYGRAAVYHKDPKQAIPHLFSFNSL
jgi:hypothetical protein